MVTRSTINWGSNIRAEHEFVLHSPAIPQMLIHEVVVL